jgi:hypothetical protein
MRRLALLVIFTAACGSALAAWDYREEKDEMSGGTIKWATIDSSNQVTFGSPYGGPQRATLHLRIHPRRDRNAILSLERGQFICRIDSCSVLARFDDGKPVRFSAIRPADHSSEYIFIRDYARLVSGLKGAKILRIEADFFHQGSHIFEFHVGGLRWDEPAAKKTQRKDVARETETDDTRVTDQLRQKAQREKTLNCVRQAADVNLKGDELKKFIVGCLKG